MLEEKCTKSIAEHENPDCVDANSVCKEWLFPKQSPAATRAAVVYVISSEHDLQLSTYDSRSHIQYIAQQICFLLQSTTVIQH